MEEITCHTKTVIVIPIVLTGLVSSPTTAWSNGGYIADPSNPDYGTHDWIAEHALDWLPNDQKQYILNNFDDYLCGTELPDNGGVPDGIGDLWDKSTPKQTITTPEPLSIPTNFSTSWRKSPSPTNSPEQPTTSAPCASAAPAE